MYFVVVDLRLLVVSSKQKRYKKRHLNFVLKNPRVTIIPKLTTKVLICDRCFPLLKNLESSSSLGNASFKTVSPISTYNNVRPNTQDIHNNYNAIILLCFPAI